MQPLARLYGQHPVHQLDCQISSASAAYPGKAHWPAELAQSDRAAVASERAAPDSCVACGLQEAKQLACGCHSACSSASPELGAAALCLARKRVGVAKAGQGSARQRVAGAQVKAGEAGAGQLQVGQVGQARPVSLPDRGARQLDARQLAHAWVLRVAQGQHAQRWCLQVHLPAQEHVSDVVSHKVLCSLGGMAGP